MKCECSLCSLNNLHKLLKPFSAYNCPVIANLERKYCISVQLSRGCVPTSGLARLNSSPASSSVSNSHFTGAGKLGGTFRIVPKKSSTNFWTVPLVESSLVRKISGMACKMGSLKQK